MAHQKQATVYFDSDNTTIAYAAAELASYLTRLTASSHTAKRSKEPAAGIRLGLLEEFSLQPAAGADPFFDDEIYVDLTSGQGIVAGNNPRSVLLAVYRLLKEAGCAFLRPGAAGDYIPRQALASLTIKLHETPSYRHRGIDFGGQKSREDVLDMIRWAPKLGFNSIFFEGIEPWQGSFYSSDRQADGSRTRLYSEDLAKTYYEEAVAEVKRLGLLFHAAGHGFTSAPFAILPGHRGQVSDEVRRKLALIDGKRQLRGNFSDTNLCYSNAQTRHLITDYIVSLLKTRPEIDLLHVWLADGNNNHCECSQCIKLLPADLYIKTLNELDEKLTRHQIKTKLVFISYTDLIWRPQKEKLINKDRFILTQAPFYRTYNKSLGEALDEKELPVFQRNQNKYPVSSQANTGFIKSWQDWWGRDSFLFEYHYWRAHYSDPGQFSISRVLYDDIKNLAKMGQTGYISCQVIKCFWPLGLGMQVLGQTLWDSSTSYASIAENYFKSSYGQAGPVCLDFFRKLSALYGLDPQIPLPEDFSWTDSGYEKYALAQKKSQDLADLIDLVAEFADFTAKKLADQASEHYISWQYLAIYLQLLSLLLLTWESKLFHDQTRTRQLWRILETFIRKHEPEIGRVFDTGSFLSWVAAYFK